MNAKAASRVEAIASIRVFVFARIPPPEDEKKEALRSCSLRGFDFILVILVVVFVFVFGDGGFCRRGHRGGRGEQKKKEEEDSAFAATVVVVDDSIIIIIIFIYTRNCFVVLYVFVVSCVFFCFLFFFVFFFFRQKVRQKKRTLLCRLKSVCVWILFNSITTHFFGTKIKVLLLGEMEVMEARTKGSGWEITSTLNAQEKKKKKKNDEELVACAEKEEEEEEEEEAIFKNAIQSFSLISALRYAPTRDGVHQRTGESAKGAVSRSSKKPMRSGNEENELDGAALTEIRSNSSRKKRKQRDVRKTKSLERKLSENQQHDDVQPQEEFEEEEEEEEEDRRQQNNSITTAVKERGFFALYGDEANVRLKQADTNEDLAKKEEDGRRKISPPETKISYANMRKEAVPGTVQITSASGKNYVVSSSTKGWSEVGSNNALKAIERIETGPIIPASTSTRAPDEAAGSCGIFSTGSGKIITFKNIEKSLAKGRALLSDPDTNGEAPSSPQNVNHRSQYLNALNSKVVENGPLDYHTPMNSSRQAPRAGGGGGGGGGLGSSIFSTGNGKTMRVSEASLEKARMLLDANEAANKTPMNTSHVGSSAQTMSEKRPPGFPFVEKETRAPNSAPSAAHFRAAYNYQHHQQRQYQNLSRMNPEQHRALGVNALTPPAGSTRMALQQQKQSTLNHLPTHDLFKSRIHREPLSKYFDGALPFSKMSDAPMTDILASRITFDNAQEYRINNIIKSAVASSLDAQSLTLGWRDIRDLMFTRGAKEKNLGEDWCANAYRHVVWTAASLKRAFSGKANQALSAKHLLERMMYRYEREINQSRRPILRKVLERDSPPTVPMILLVSAVRSFGILLEEDEENEENEGVKEKCKNFYSAEIEVSDGWYSIRAVLDEELSSHLRANRIRPGSKMFVQNCQLSGIPEGEGVQPLKPEAYKARLLLHSNSCRPCEWDAKLGLQKVNLTVPLRSVRTDGGDVPRVLLKISRHFPPVYRERSLASRDNDGNVDSAAPIFVTRREESEIAEREKFETQQRRVVEKAVSKDNVENELRDRNDYEEAVNVNRTSHFERQRDLRQEEVKLRALEEAGIPERRNVSRVCKILTHGLMSDTKRRHRIDTSGDNNCTSGFDQAVVMVWDADEAFSSGLEEGSVYAVTHLKSSEGKDDARQKTLQLSVTKHTRWTKISPDTLQNAGLQIVEKIAYGSESYLDCLAIHLLTGPRFVENDGRRFARWMFFVEIKNDDGSIHTNTIELFALKVSSWDEDELDKNCTRWTNVCQKSNHHCVIVKNITPCGFDERNRVKKSSASVDVLEVASASASLRNGKHLARRFDRFQSSYGDKTRGYIQSMKLRATALVNNSNSAAVSKEIVKEPTLSQFTPPRVEFNEDEPGSDGQRVRRRSSIRFSDSEGWGGSQFPHSVIEDCLKERAESLEEPRTGVPK